MVTSNASITGAVVSAGIVEAVVADGELARDWTLMACKLPCASLQPVILNPANNDVNTKIFLGLNRKFFIGFSL